MLHPFKNKRSLIARFLQISCLSVALFFGSLQSAHAQFATIDVSAIAEAVEQAAKDAAQWVVQNYNAMQANMLIAGNGNITNNSGMLQTLAHQQISTSNANVQNEMTIQAHNGQTNAELSAATTVSNTSTYGAEIALRQAINEAKSAAEAAGLFAANALRAGTGTSADQTSSVAQLNQICSRAGQGWSFYDPIAYKGVVDQITCPNFGGKITLDTTSGYVNADKSEESVIGYVQYPIPQGATVSKDNHITFNNVQSAVDTPYNDPVRFVAAWNKCQSLYKAPPTPPSTNSPNGFSPKDLSDIISHSDVVGQYNSSVSTCFKNMLLRTACGSGAPCNSLSGGGPSLYTLQQRVCNLLTSKTALTDPSPVNTADSQVGLAGLGITDGVNDRELDNILKNCQNNGISVEAAEKIYAHRFESAAYDSYKSGETKGDASQAVHQITVDGPQAKVAYESEHQLEIGNFYNSMNLSLQREIQASLEKQNQQLAEQNKTLIQQTQLLLKQTQLLTQVIEHESPVVAGR